MRAEKIAKLIELLRTMKNRKVDVLVMIKTISTIKRSSTAILGFNMADFALFLQHRVLFVGSKD